MRVYRSLIMNYIKKEAKFIIKLKKGDGNFKGQLRFKYFECGNIGHYASKYPYAKVNSSDDEVKFKYNDYKLCNKGLVWD